jgi:asparagine synthase (glutamine-hydrolysing)
MCGIVGIIGAGASELPAQALERMMRVQAHRGPDSEGRWQDSIGSRTVALGSSRLAILDLSPAGEQPMHSPSGRQVLVYNGEVYNYRELRLELEQAGVRFRGHSDSEVILHALLRWGEDAPRRFNGMWALAFLDRDAGTLLLSRDPFGIKPLYLHQGNRGLYFASEIKSILAGTGERFAVNHSVASRYLQQALLDAQDETFFAGIRSCPAGNNLRIDLRTGEGLEPVPRRYWNFPVRGTDHPEDGRCIDAVREVFLDSVRIRLRSDVPVGVLLSGGLDSSCIASVMHSNLRDKEGLVLISGVSEDPRFSEERFIDRMADHLGFQAHKVTLRCERVLDTLEEVTWFNDEPVGSLSSLAHYQLMQKAKELGITVILSGQGADELLCGYDKYVGFYLQSLARDGEWPEAFKVLAGFARNGTVLSQFKWSEAKRYLPALLRPKQIDIRGPILRNGNDLLDIGLGPGDLFDRQTADLSRFSIPALVHYEDRMSMACSREIRLPYLDPRLVETILPLRPEWKLRNGWTKWVLRRAMEDRLPADIVWRKDKQPFTNPQSEWLKHELKDKISGMLGDEMRIARIGLVDQSALRRQYEAYCRQPALKGPLSFKDVFTPLALEVWARRFESHLRLE